MGLTNRVFSFSFFGYIVSVLAIRMGKVSFTSQSRYSGLLVTLVVDWFSSHCNYWNVYVLWLRAKKGVVDTESNQ